MELTVIFNVIIYNFQLNSFLPSHFVGRDTNKGEQTSPLQNNSAIVETPLMASLRVTRHPELVSGSLGFSDGMLKQVQQDGIKKMPAMTVNKTYFLSGMTILLLFPNKLLRSDFI